MRYLQNFLVRECVVLVLLCVMTLVFLYPLSVNLSSMVPEPSDPLLNVWRMHWAKHAILSGPRSMHRLFDANIFYPYRMTLAFSEHCLAEMALALPFLLAANSHLVGMNLTVVASFTLTAYAMYLLISDWSRNRTAGLVAGFLFAFSPFRFGHIHHLELLATQWMPLTLLSLHWLLTDQTAARTTGGPPKGRRPLALVLFILFFNLQALSSIHYTVHLAIACVLLAGIYGLTGRIRWHWNLLTGLSVFAAITIIINLPIWRVYLRFSEVMGAERTPGEVRVYSAAISDYLTTIPHNLLYGWTFGHWQSAGHQYQPLMPVGVVGLVLATVCVIWLLCRSPRARAGRAMGILLIAIASVGFILSLGTNEEAFGPALAPVLSHILPYGWLYEQVPIFKGMRVPARYGVLVVIGLAGLAGWGFAVLQRGLAGWGNRAIAAIVPVILIALAVAEYWSVPLAGPQFPHGESVPAVYGWLGEAEDDAVVLELPQQGASEFVYEYFSTYHWRRLVNGGTGYTPPIVRQMRQWFKTFPDWRSIDVIQQLGVDYVVLHQSEMAPKDWEAIQELLPGYLYAFDGMYQVGSAVVLHVAPSQCKADLATMTAALSFSSLSDETTAVLTYHNHDASTFVADMSRNSWLEVDGKKVREFLEPLLVLPNETRSVHIAMDRRIGNAERVEARLATLDRSVVAGASEKLFFPAQPAQLPKQRLDLQFHEGPRLEGLTLSSLDPQACNVLELALHWQGGVADDAAVVRLVDRFGRVVMESQTLPWVDNTGIVSDPHRLPLPGSLPPGEYGLKVAVQTPAGEERPVVSDAGDLIAADQLPPWPVVVRPLTVSLPDDTTPRAVFANGVELLDTSLADGSISAGDWLRFTITWRTREAIDQDLTVFTQLIGPDGRVWGQRDNPPRGGWYPLRLWRAGEVVQDDYVFLIDPRAPAGTYQLVAGLYESQTLERLRVEGTDADYVTLGEYRLVRDEPFFR